MPFAGFDDFDSCVVSMQNEGYDKESAKKICGALQSEYEENGKESAKDLLEKIKTHADNIITDLHLKLLSVVENPAQPSDIVLTKDDDEDKDFKKEVPVLQPTEKTVKENNDDEPVIKLDNSDKQIVYAPAMVPNITDKQGDVIPAHVIEESAHGFIKNDGGVDTDHDLIEGKGQVVESWILKTDREFKLHDSGKTKKYPKGTWMVGVQLKDEAWERVQNGELTGFSIYGTSDKYNLKDLNERNINSKNNNNTDDNMDEDQFNELKDDLNEMIKDQLTSIKEVLQESQEEQESSEEESDEKQDMEVEDLADAMDWLDENAPPDVESLIVDAVRGNEEAEEEQESDDGEEQESEKEAKYKQNDTRINEQENIDTNEEDKSKGEIAKSFVE